jgi:hypothetical protein
MKVKAIKRGYDGQQIREPGDVFEFKGKLGKWMIEVDDQGKPVKKEEPKAPKEPKEHKEPKAK